MDRKTYYQNYAKRTNTKEKKARLCEYRKRRLEQARHEVLQHYSGGTPRCACPNCSEHSNPHLAFLTIDHINGGGDAHRSEIGQGGMVLYRWLKKNNWPDGFQILCMNCNFAKRGGGVCPHHAISSEEN